MPPVYLPKSDEALETWAVNFSTGLATYGTTLGLTVDQIKSFNDAKTAYVSALAAHNQAINAAKGAKEAKDTTRRSLIVVAGVFNTLVQTNSKATDQIKANMGLRVRRRPAPVTPVAPANLVVTGIDTGINQLKWSANGNRVATDYIVEAFYPGATGWVFVDAVSRTRYSHSGQTPGVKVVYRVKARRRTVFSDYSNQATVYETPDNNTVTLKKAA